LLAISTGATIIGISPEIFRVILSKGELIKMLFAPKEKGQGLVEYALILVLVAIVVIAALMILGPIIGNTFSTINKSLNSV
jgi:pilus assembly protein Flp/PilA